MRSSLGALSGRRRADACDVGGSDPPIHGKQKPHLDIKHGCAARVHAAFGQLCAFDSGSSSMMVHVTAQVRCSGISSLLRCRITSFAKALHACLAADDGERAACQHRAADARSLRQMNVRSWLIAAVQHTTWPAALGELRTALGLALRVCERISRVALLGCLAVRTEVASGLG